MQRGFTLVELLIVIAILAVLSVTVVVVLNPAELLKQARDSTRISDLASINSAIALYLTDIASPGIGGINDTACSARLGRLTAGGTSPFLAGMTPTVDSTTEVDGNAWNVSPSLVEDFFGNLNQLTEEESASATSTKN